MGRTSRLAHFGRAGLFVITMQILKALLYNGLFFSLKETALVNRVAYFLLLSGTLHGLLLLGLTAEQTPLRPTSVPPFHLTLRPLPAHNSTVKIVTPLRRHSPLRDQPRHGIPAAQTSLTTLAKKQPHPASEQHEQPSTDTKQPAPPIDLTGSIREFVATQRRSSNQNSD